MSSPFAVRRLPLSIFTPMPPERTGIAHYASMLIPALQQHAEVEVITFGKRLTANGERIYQLGNNPHHAWIYEEAMRTPGVIVLHDLVLHHLIVEMTLARGDVNGYIEALRANHGEAGAAWARGRAAGLHSEMGNFLYPASIDIANRSRAVIVHNHYAADRLRSFGVTTPIHVVPHPYDPSGAPPPSAASNGVIGLFGFLTSAKRSDVVLEAFRKTKNRKLLVVGEPAPNIDVNAFRAEGIEFTGYVEDFDRYFGEVDRLVNLRYPSAGETSGTLIRAFAAGKPVAVSNYAQFAELPNDCVVKIPLGEGEVDALADFMTRDLPDPSAAQRKWLEEHANIEETVGGYLEAVTASGERQAARVITRSIALFPNLQLVRMQGRQAIIRNDGEITLKARAYDEPAYRIVVKSGVSSRWLDLPCDLRPGETAVIDVPLPPGVITFHHALQSVAMLDPEPWARAAIQ